MIYIVSHCKSVTPFRPSTQESSMIYIVSHCKSVTPFRPCMDGLFAAAIANMRHPEAHLIPAMYGLENAPNLNLKPGDLVYLLD